MPKHYTEEELKNGRWVTMHGARVFIKDGESVEDATARLKRSMNKSPERKDMTWEEKREIADRFTLEYGIGVDTRILQELPDDTFNMVFDTLKEQLDYEGNDDNGYSNLLFNTVGLSDLSAQKAMASMSSDGTLLLDEDTFSKGKEELEIMCANAANRHKHPSPEAKSMIIHELGHARFNKVLADMYEEYANSDDFEVSVNAESDWYAILEECASYSYNKGAGFFGNPNKNFMQEGRFYYNFVNKVNNFAERVRNSINYKVNGGNPNAGLAGMAEYNPHSYTNAMGGLTSTPTGISRYAGANIQEMCAEAYADVMCNGEKASFMSQMVYQEFLSQPISAEDKAEWERMMKEMGK